MSRAGFAQANGEYYAYGVTICVRQAIWRCFSRRKECAYLAAQGIFADKRVVTARKNHGFSIYINIMRRQHEHIALENAAIL